MFSLWEVVLVLVLFSSASFKMKTEKYPNYRRLYLSMDDEVARNGIKTELTTLHDDYFDTSAIRLSGSGHLLSLPSEDTLRQMESHPISSALLDEYQKNDILGFKMKGLYVHRIGGLPLFSSGNRIDSLCTRQYLVCSHPCDFEHIIINESSNEIRCTRTGLTVGFVNITTSSTQHRLYHFHSTQLYFLPIDLPWPIDCQPENIWGSEGQYRAWNGHELASRPLSY